MKSTSNSDTAGQTQPQEPQLKLSRAESNHSNSRITEYQNKLASIKMKNSQRSGAETATHKQQSNLIGAGASNAQHLNTSFSAMNSSLSQKWNEINKKNAQTKREG